MFSLDAEKKGTDPIPADPGGMRGSYAKNKAF